MVDPYDWLGVPKTQRPPTHYQLLGLSPHVTESVSIREAAVRQLNKLQPHLSGPQAVSAERLQREINEARDTLLDPEQRRLYDILTPSFDEPFTPPAPPPAVTPPMPTASHVPTATAPRMGGPSEWWREVSSEPVAPAATIAKPWWKETPPVEADEPPPPPPPTAPPKHLEKPHEVVEKHPTLRPTSDTESHERRPNLSGMNTPIRAKQSGPPIGLIAAGLLLLVGVGGAVVAWRINSNKTTTPTEHTPTPPVDVSQGNQKPPPPAEGKAIDIDQPGPVPVEFADQLKPRAFAGHQRAVVGIAIAKNGTRIASIGSDRSIRLWSLRKDVSVVRHNFTSPGISVAFGAEDSKIIACDAPNFAVMEALKSSAPRLVESAQGGHLCLAVTPDGATALAGMSTGDLRVYDTQTMQFQGWLSGGNSVLTTAISDDGATGFSAIADGPVTQWNMSNRTKVHQWTPHEASGGAGTIAMQVAPNGKLIATGGVDNMATVYDLMKRKEVCRITGHTGPVTGIAWMADSKRLVTCSNDGTVRLWNAENGQSLRWVHSVPGKLQCVVRDPKEQFVMVGSSSGNMHLLPLPRVRSEAAPQTTAKAPPDPLPTPMAKDIATAVQMIRNELSGDYRYTRQDDMLVLANNLFQRTAQENLSPPVRYAYFQEARRLAISADDPDLAFRVNGTLATWFEVDELAENVAVVTQFPGKADRRALLLNVLTTVERAEKDVRPDILVQLLKVLPAPATVPEELKARVTGANTRAEATLKEATDVRAALATLKSAPTEPNACLVVGRFLCFARQDWTAGLPYLAKGNDAGLREAANAELVKQVDPKLMFQMGEGWRLLALKTAEARTKQAMLLRAKTWFEKSATTATDLTDKVKARAKIDDVEKTAVPNDPNALPLGVAAVIRKHFDTMAPHAATNEWHLAGEAEFQPQGARLKAMQPALTSRFEIGDGTRLIFTLTPDGRELKFTCNETEFTVSGTASSIIVTLERRQHTLYFTQSLDGAKPTGKTVELPEAKRGTSVVALRQNGMPKLTEGTLVTSVLVRGPVQFVPPKPE